MILVLHDLSPQADHAAWRAGMIARDRNTRLCLLHASGSPGGDARAKHRLDALADELGHRLGVLSEVRMAIGDPLHAVVRAGRDADLVVLGARRGNVLREWVFGTQAERLIRLGAKPVLVVKKRALARYRRVLVPVDFGPSSARAIAAAAQLSRGTAIEVFHALAARDEVTLRAHLPEAQLRRHRRGRTDRAHALLMKLIQAVPGASLTALPGVGFGHPASAVLVKEQAMHAELVVIGKRSRGLLADFFLGSVTQRVLAAARADVLVLPARQPGPDPRLRAAPSCT